jgi:hypothetical protein
MSDVFSDLPAALLPIYQMTEPNQPITLYDGKMSIVQNDQSLSGEGKIQVRWFPHPANRFELQNVNLPYHRLDVGQKVKVIADNLGIEFDGTLINNSMGSEGVLVKGILSSNIEIGDSSKLQSIVFHLTNFFEFLGDLISYGGGRSSRSELRQESKDWILTIHALKDVKDILEKLKDTGGYAVTHVAKLEKKTGTFSGEEARDILRKLYWYFSFIRGLHTSPYLVTGYDEDHTKVCEFWNGGMRQSSYSSVGSWFPLDLDGLDKDLLGEYLDLVSDKSWYEVISKAINWYVESQKSTFTEQSIVWSQLCIELLSWAKFVELNPHISKSGFNSLDLGNRLRLILSMSGIPTNIPTELAELEKLAKSNQWDGPQAVAETRNSIAHPNLRERLAKNGWQVTHEVKKLSLWYAELAILKLLDYQGDYHNHLKHRWSLEKEPVPWLTQ